MPRSKTYRALIIVDVDNDPGLDNANLLMSQGWKPEKATPMASSCAAQTGPLSVVHPTCLLILASPAGYQVGDETLPRDPDTGAPVRPDPDEVAKPKVKPVKGKPTPPASKLTKAITPKGGKGKGKR